MNSSKTCVHCKKASGSIHCTGCENYYCFKCFTIHRQKFNEELDKVINERDITAEQLDRMSKSKYDSNQLMPKIDEWEQRMLAKVKEIANEQRQKLRKLLDNFESNVTVKFKSFSTDLVNLRDSENYTEIDIQRIRLRLQLLKGEIEAFPQFCQGIILTDNSHGFNWSKIINLSSRKEIMPSTYKCSLKILNIPYDAEWSNSGNKVVQNLNSPEGLSIDAEDGNMFIADTGNERIVVWNKSSNSVETLLGNLSEPGVILVDKPRDSLLISDRGSRKLLRCSLSSPQKHIKVVVDNIQCNGLAIDEGGAIYVVDMENHSVRIFEDGDENGVIVAGGNGRGNKLNQLNRPNYIAIDHEQSVYISDAGNGRIMKWKKGATTGEQLVNSLNHTNGILLDRNGAIYISELMNHRVTRWKQSDNQKETLLGRKETDEQLRSLRGPDGIDFDNDYNMYVVDLKDNCVKCFPRIK